MQQFYLQQQWLSSGSINNMVLMQVHSTTMLCISQGNKLSFYSLHPSLNLIQQHTFQCQISKIQVLPSRHHPSDYLLVLDSYGRWGIWSLQGQMQYLQNTRLTNKYALYQHQTSQTQVKTFSGHTHYFQVNDTKGTLFMMVANQLVLVDYSINRLGIKVQKNRKVELPMVEMRYMDWLEQSRGKCLGVVQEKQQKSIFSVYDIENSSVIANETLKFKLQLVNLYQFSSNQSQIALLTDLQVIILDSTSFNILSRWSIPPKDGKLIPLLKGFGFVGQQIAIWSQGKSRGYGSLMYGNQSIVQGRGVAGLLRVPSEKGIQIIIATLSNNLFRIRLYDNMWQLVDMSRFVSSVYSLHATCDPNKIVAVVDSSNQSYQVVVVQKCQATNMVASQDLQMLVQRLYLMDDHNILVSSSNHSYLYQWMQNNFVLISELQGTAIAANSSYIVLQSQIYTLQNGGRQLVHQDQFIMAHITPDYLYVMNAEGKVMLVTKQGFMRQIRKGQEYAWTWVNQLCISANITDLGRVVVYKQAQIVREIVLEEASTISQMNTISYKHQQHISTYLVIGYLNGKVYIYTLQGQLLTSFNNCSKHPIHFFDICPSCLGINTGHQQFLLNFQPQPYLTPISLSQNNSFIKQIVYIKSKDQLVFVQQGTNQQSHTLRHCLLNSIKYQQNSISPLSSYRIRSISHNQQIPIVHVHNNNIHVHNNNILIAIKQSLSIYDLLSGRQLLTKKTYLKQPTGIQKIDLGILLYGTDLLQRNTIYLYSQQYQQIGRHILILKDSKYIKNIKVVGSNMFLCRGQKNTFLFQFNNTQDLSQIEEYKSDMTGYHLDACCPWSVQTDNQRLIVLYHSQNNIVPVARYLADRQVSDVVVLERCIVFADITGMLGVLQYNVSNRNQALRSQMTLVGQIDVGERITCLSKSNSQTVFYGTQGGQIGLLRVLQSQKFQILQKVEEIMNGQMAKQCVFSYAYWRKRIPGQDKLIDFGLVQKYMVEHKNRTMNENQQEMLEIVSTLASSLII